MIYKNIDFHGVAEILPTEDGGIAWRRVPERVESQLERGEQSLRMNRGSTGVELRFVMKSDTVTIRMAKNQADRVANRFHVFRGGIQGGWQDHELGAQITDTYADFTIQRSKNSEYLHRVAASIGDAWDPDVVRVIFDRGGFRILDIIGDVEPPRAGQTPPKTLLAYGSSITHGSNALDASHAWVSLVARALHMDARNLGFAGSCLLEPAMAEYLAEEGEAGHWDLATLELGINALDWEADRIRDRVRNMLRTVACRNPEKPVFVISPFTCQVDFKGGVAAENWRRLIEEVVGEERLPNVTSLNGKHLLTSVGGLSADEVHPNIYGVAEIAENLTAAIRKAL